MKIGFGESFFLVHYSRGNFLPINNERDEDRLSLMARDTVATESNIFDGDFNRGWSVGHLEL